MTSTFTGPSGMDDRPSGEGVATDENQLDLFEIPPRSGIRTEQPLAVGGDGDAGSSVLELPAETQVAEPPAVDRGRPEREALDIAGPGSVQTIAAPVAARGFLDAGVAESEDLRRLEESIRWLMIAGTTPLPRTTPAPLPPVSGLSPLDPHDDDAFLLDPETLFPPRAPRRTSPAIASGAAKVLLVSAIAAPTAYFVASWAQFPGAAAPSDPAAIAAMAAPALPSGEQVVAMAAAPSVPATPDTVALAAPAVPLAQDSVEVLPAPNFEPAAAPRPTVRSAPGMVVAALATGPETTGVKNAAEPPSGAAVQAADSVSAPSPVLLPPKPTLRQDEIAMMVERGRVLFEAGDLAAARLFFRRAANAGDAAAAIAMGATYDPEVLAQRFIRGIEANAQEAQRWYEKARDMGQRVELAQRR